MQIIDFASHKKARQIVRVQFVYTASWPWTAISLCLLANQAILKSVLRHYDLFTEAKITKGTQP